ASMHNIWAASFLHTLRKPIYLSNLALQTYVEDMHLPGYMLGLEDELARADIVIASGFSDQATQQALRYCRQNNKALVVFSSDPLDFIWAMDQDKNALEDLLNFAKGFWVYGDEAAESLLFWGVEDRKILKLSPRIHAQRFDFHLSGRDRFRNYLKIPADDFLVLCSDPLTRNSGALCLLYALKRLMDIQSNAAARFRLLFTGGGELKEQIKHLAVDLGLSRQLLFIAQDTSLFQTDLYCASDLAISWIQRSDPESAHATFWILEAMACGVRPLVCLQHPLAESLAQDSAIEQSDFSMLALAYAEAYSSQHEARHGRQVFIAQCRRDFDTALSAPKVQEFFEQLDAQCPGGFIALHQNFWGLMENLKLNLARLTVAELLPSIEQGLQVWAWHPEYRSQLQIFKGHLLLKENDLEGALACFEVCTADECVHREAYLGLARIAFLTYSAEEALSFYRKALAIRPNEYHWGQSFYSHGSWSTLL
ncbi:MAG: hypothetical protein NTX25_07050, partial [Proteobacteria bacterium]|nr:hypothetical protein [Pseudomonadota bacterium]